MPEGPSMFLVKEAAKKFVGKKIIAFSGDSKIDQSILLDQVLIDFKSWGKHLLIYFNGLTLRVYFV